LNKYTYKFSQKMWQKNFTKEIPFLPSLIIIMTFFLTSVIIIYYTSVGSQAMINNYSNIIAERASFITGDIRNIIVTSPQENQSVGTNFNITGLAKVSATTIHYRIINSKKEILQQGTTPTNQPGKFSPFLVEINLTKENLTTQGTIELYTLNSSDSSIENFLSVPVNF